MGNRIERDIYHKITCKAAFRKLKQHLGPYEYDMNIYRGCAHRCAYCYAIYSQRYMENTDFYHHIYVKENIVEQLEKQLSSPRWKRHVICIGSICDSYQPIEATQNIMPQILRLFIRYQTPCIILTKSDLILRDIELIKELANITYVGIGSTITTLDENIARIIEPGAVSSKRRVAMLKRMRMETTASVGLHMSPILPHITDQEAQIEAMMKVAKEIDVEYMLTGVLNLIKDTKQHFFHMLEENYPQLVQEYQRLYPYGRLDKTYKQEIYARIRKYQKLYNINMDHMKHVREFKQRTDVEQLTFW